MTTVGWYSIIFYFDHLDIPSLIIVIAEYQV